MKTTQRLLLPKKILSGAIYVLRSVVTAQDFLSFKENFSVRPVCFVGVFCFKSYPLMNG